jgi:hypothetical protein
MATRVSDPLLRLDEVELMRLELRPLIEIAFDGPTDLCPALDKPAVVLGESVEECTALYISPVHMWWIYSRHGQRGARLHRGAQPPRLRLPPRDRAPVRSVDDFIEALWMLLRRRLGSPSPPSISLI